MITWPCCVSAMQISDFRSDTGSADDLVSSVSAVIGRYRELYRRLYLRDPYGIRDLGTGWVVVNGARMRVSELEKLTDQMQSRYRQTIAQKRNVVKRLVTWLRSH